MTYYLEFTDADDPREKDAFGERLEAHTPIPYPSVGELALVEGKYLKVVSRKYYYSDDRVHVQVFCRQDEAS